MDLALSEEQEVACDAIEKLVFNKDSGRPGMPRMLTMSGYAGTGKTTVMGVAAARLVQRNPSLCVAFCAPTGKAVRVLSEKLRNFGALTEFTWTGTIHSLLYRPVSRQAGAVVWERKEAPLGPFDLIVIDEASMVTSRMFEDLRNMGAPLLFIGDPGQLPPVNDKLFEPLIHADVCLKTVHRQALDNPIVAAATNIRNGGSIPFGVWGGKLARLPRNHQKAIESMNRFLHEVGDDGTAILCGTNSTRQRLNRRARAARGIFDKLPRPGERLVCLRNDRAYSFCNGELFVVGEKGADDTSENVYRLHLSDFPVGVFSYKGALGCKDGSSLGAALYADAASIRQEIQECGTVQEELCLFDYGYALSVHKAQGSEWSRVLLINERNSHMSDDDYRRWLYTGTTRAKEKLLIIG